MFSTATPPTPLKDAVAHDHQEMYEYYEQFQKHAGNTDLQKRWAHQLTWEVVRHAAGEEIIVYPLMEASLGQEGKALADQDREDHQSIKIMLAQLESMHVGTDEYNTLMSKMMAQLREHNDSEEKHDLPLLEGVLHLDNSKEAAHRFSITKHFVPTRAHPLAPDQSHFKTLVAFMTAPVDKLKDVFTSFPTGEMKKEAEDSSR
ncbi:hypothetical protein PAXRUDRAFT_823679 [Paxillus rubicundulus Ve08.2h10]|uniref:Hemerythrin-like domain-containing protein n=1 Tax=Paxillus rubicundulus Ve08.2h10 TaxID=930991 RepID=A0A0D0E8M4_9AGAM|nr:hypothetical protein PAXRUDRAFT_823679 [Paxillus rubicundulus Ve08.2h10]